MKRTKQLYVAIALILVTCLLLSCKKDKVEGPAKNSYTYQNGGNPQTHNIGNAVFDNGGTAARFLLYNSNNPNDGVEITLRKNTVFTAIPEGNFTNSTAGTVFNDATLYYNDGDESYSVDGIARSVNVTKNGGNYTINFEFTSGMGLVKGHYSGPVSE